MLPPCQCHDNRLFSTSDFPNTARSTCTLCRFPYFVHRRIQTSQQDFSTVPHGSSSSMIPVASQPSDLVQVPRIPSGSSVPVPRSQSSASSVLTSAGSHVSSSSLQRYLQSPDLPLMNVSAPLPLLTGSSTQQLHSSLTSWTRPGPPPPGSTNDRRIARASVARTRGVTSSPLAPVPTFHRQPIHRRQLTSQSSSAAASSAPPLRGNNRARKYLVMVHPEPAHGTIATDSGDIFSILRAPVPQKIERFVSHADSYHLMFSLECTARDIDKAAPAVHAELQSHLSRHGLAFATSSTGDSSSSGNQSTGLSIPWGFLVTHKGQRTTAFGAKLLPTKARTDVITHGDLAKIAKRLPMPPPPYEDHALVFILPAENVIVGPLNGSGMHYCLARHLWNSFSEAKLDEPYEDIECSPSCHTDEMLLDETHVAVPETPPGRGESPFLSSTSRQRLPSNLPQLSSSNANSGALLSPLLDHGVGFHIYPGLPSIPHLPGQQFPASSDTLSTWRQHLDDTIATIGASFTDTETQVTITAETPLEAAKGFLDLCISWSRSIFGFSVNDGQISLSFTSGQFQNCNPTTINFNNITVNIGDGVGNGPLRSFWGALITLITEQSGHWHQTSEDGYFVPIVTSLPPSEDDLRAFRAYGLILRTGLIWGMDLLPISPAIILLLIADYRAATRDAFLEQVVPATFSRLRTWPPPTAVINGTSQLQIVPATDPYTMVLEVDHSIQVCFKPTLYYRSNACMKDCSSFYQHSESSPVEIISALFSGRKVTTIGQVLDLLDPFPLPSNLESTPGFDPLLDYPSLASRWMLHLKRYLRGIGEPRDADNQTMFDESQDNSDPLYRVKLFLLCTTASVYLPITNSSFQKIKVCCNFFFLQYWAC
ncbi:hypothetical protein JVT61DRAFT_14951 [Boletus reticuloceps]|uniref:Uncharacterized protein n=1 Tax=Boletus reticuloceps TaxID=495285 RepID=A0A8I2YCG3_9AGAM|nr:hypothetical protein JVT61DRAFT_14951 [Boletus reticuloceps]